MPLKIWIVKSYILEKGKFTSAFENSTVDHCVWGSLNQNTSKSDWGSCDSEGRVGRQVLGNRFDSPAPPTAWYSVLEQDAEHQIAPDEQVGALHLLAKIITISAPVWKSLKRLQKDLSGSESHSLCGLLW